MAKIIYMELSPLETRWDPRPGFTYNPRRWTQGERTLVHYPDGTAALCMSRTRAIRSALIAVGMVVLCYIAGIKEITHPSWNFSTLLFCLAPAWILFDAIKAILTAGPQYGTVFDPGLGRILQKGVQVASYHQINHVCLEQDPEHKGYLKVSLVRSEEPPIFLFEDEYRVRTPMLKAAGKVADLLNVPVIVRLPKSMAHRLPEEVSA